MFVHGDLRLKLRTPQPKWHDVFVYGGTGPKLWTKPARLLVVCQFLSSVTLSTLYLSTGETLV